MKKIKTPRVSIMLDKLIRGLKRGKKKHVKVSFLGLDQAGKTTIIEWLSSRDFTNPSRTLGINVTSSSNFQGFPFLESLDLSVWDIGGQEQFRANLWKEWVLGSEAIVFVIDANDKNRYEKAISELYRAVSLPQGNKVFLYILLNKLDLLEEVLTPLGRDKENGIDEERIVEEGDIHAIINKKLTEEYLDDFMWQMNLENLASNFKKHVQLIQIYGTSAKTGLGLKEAFEDLLQKLLQFEQDPKETTKELEYIPPMQSLRAGIHNVYVLTEGGVTVVSAKIGSIDKDPSLVGGLITAITIGAKDIFGDMKEEITHFPLGKYSVYMRKFGILRVAVVADPETHSRALERVAQIANKIINDLKVVIPEKGGVDLSNERQREFESRLITIFAN